MSSLEIQRLAVSAVVAGAHAHRRRALDSGACHGGQHGLPTGRSEFLLSLAGWRGHPLHQAAFARSHQHGSHKSLLFFLLGSSRVANLLS